LTKDQIGMSADKNLDIASIVRNFRIDGDFISGMPYGSGHINDTYLGRFKTPAGEARYIHQRINHNIFKQPELLIENIARVTTHLRSKIQKAGGDPNRESLTLVPANDGKFFHKTPAGDYWRTYLFIDRAKTYDLVETPEHLRSGGQAFGRFGGMLGDMKGEPLHETIPMFHHTPNRLALLREAIDADCRNRAAGVKKEIQFALERSDEMGTLVRLQQEGKLPVRITHNDTKFNNVMIDDDTQKAICVIDLDTVMPGLVLYDFGDMVRTGTITAMEDEPDVSKVGANLTMFEALVRGYLEGAAGSLTSAEVDQFVLAGRVITFTIGVRFLTDYLKGDVYFKIRREGHNLDRCHTQFKLVSELEKHAGEMDKIVARYR
jgi:hypothetical protein